MRSSFENVKKLIATRLKKRYQDVWAMYHMVVEHHWRPADILKMDTWEVACVLAIGDQYAKDIDKIKSKR